ncbi:MAG: hypothetical protein MJD61_03630 [Proteobacteria bacterium]|nr:hypothetical protein [Pseudomonadota bacterium]
MRPTASLLLAYCAWVLAYFAFPKLSKRRPQRTGLIPACRLAFFVLLPIGALVSSAGAVSAAHLDSAVAVRLGCYLLSGLAVAMANGRPRWLAGTGVGSFAVAACLLLA